MTIDFLAWIKKLRRSKRSPQFRSAFISYAEAMEGRKQELAQLKRLQSSAPDSKPEPPAGPPEQPFQAQLIRYWAWRNEQTRRAFAGEPIYGDAAPPCPHPELHRPSTPTPLQTQILAVCHGMKLRADAEKAAAAQLREIAESLVGVITAEQGSIPATTDSGQVLVTPPKPQPTGGRLIRGDVDPGPVPSPPAPEPDSKPEPMAYWAGEIAVSVAADGSLLEMVRKALGDSQDEEPKAAVLAVARWFRDRGNSAYAALLEYQADA